MRSLVIASWMALVIASGTSATGGPQFVVVSDPQVVLGFDPASIAHADFNGDGYVDLAAAGTGGLSVCLATSQGAFAPPVLYPTNDRAVSVAVGDLNHDSRPDLAVAINPPLNNTVGAISLFLGNGDGTFGARTDHVTGKNPRQVAIRDVTGDGNADLVALNVLSSSASVLLGNGAGGFAPNVEYTTGAFTGPFVFALADLNIDGALDLVAGIRARGAVVTLLGHGDGTFGAPIESSTSLFTPTEAIAAGDLDGDGFPDLVVPGSSNVMG